MYRSFTIKNFRCFDELTVEGMGRINLIAGKNNVGKTALLEALWVHSGGADPSRLLRLDAARGLFDPDSAIRNLFFGFEDNAIVEFCALGHWGELPRRLLIYSQENPRVQLSVGGPGDNRLDIHTPVHHKQIGMDYLDESENQLEAKGWFTRDSDNPRSSTIGYEKSGQHSHSQAVPGALFLSGSTGVIGQYVERYSQLEINGKEDGVLRILQEVEPNLTRLSVLATGIEPKIYADMGTGRLIPIQLMGEGMSRVLSLALAIATAPGGIVLVDEIENGIHHSVMEKVWRAIGAFARSYDVQLFATTHSYECIGAAYRAFESDEDDEPRLFRIERNPEGKYKSVKFDRERIGSAFEFQIGII